MTLIVTLVGLLVLAAAGWIVWVRLPARPGMRIAAIVMIACVAGGIVITPLLTQAFPPAPLTLAVERLPGVAHARLIHSYVYENGRSREFFAIEVQASEDPPTDLPGLVTAITGVASHHRDDIGARAQVNLTVVWGYDYDIIRATHSQEFKLTLDGAR